MLYAKTSEHIRSPAKDQGKHHQGKSYRYKIPITPFIHLLLEHDYITINLYIHIILLLLLFVFFFFPISGANILVDRSFLSSWTCPI